MTTQTNTQGAIRPFFAGLGTRLLAAFEMIANASEAGRRAHEAERLFRMTDAELARRGLTRDGIIRHVFGPLLNM